MLPEYPTYHHDPDPGPPVGAWILVGLVILAVTGCCLAAAWLTDLAAGRP